MNPASTASDPYQRTILDPIHGAIRLSTDELNVLDHPLFRRLHRVRQNGLLYLVFPAATHSRFEHSIGTLHVAESILANLHHNSAVAASKPSPGVQDPASAQPGQAINFSSLPKSDLDFLQRYVRFAALVHDLGHGPFSHHFDSFAPTVKDVRDHLRSCPELAPLKPLTGSLSDHATDGRVDHEVVSCLLFASICADLDLREDSSLASKVSSIILNEPALAPSKFGHLIPLAHDIVASAPADADRMDYLERDSRGIGVTYGLYDRNRLLKSFLCYLEADLGPYRLGLKRSGLRAVENFIQARFELFVQVYYHKTNRAIELMLRHIATRVANEKLAPFKWGSFPELVKTYLGLSDERFLRVLEGHDQEWKLDDPGIQQVAAQISQRQLWKRIYEGDQSNCEGICEAIKKEHRDWPVCVDKLEPRPTKGLDNGVTLLVRMDGGKYQVQDGAKWLTESAIVQALHEQEGKVWRVYLHEPDPKKAEQCRRIAWKLFGKLPGGGRL